MLVLCLGTGTDVGKTRLGVEVLGLARAAGWSVAARKPVQSFDPDSDVPTDAQQLAEATGEDPRLVCPPARSLPVAMAPPMAAEALGLDPPPMASVARVLWPRPLPDLCWVEGVGGVRSPMAADGDGVDFCRLLAPELVVLVSGPGLGAVNDVRLSMAALAGLAPVVVVLAGFDGGRAVHEANRRWLADVDDFDLVTTSEGLVDRLLPGRLPR